MKPSRRALMAGVSAIAAAAATTPSPAASPSASAPAPLGYVCHRASAPLQIDGRLDDPAWRDAPWTADFVDIEGDARPRPALRTRPKMLWDDEYFYVGAEMAEPHLWATLTRHDAVIFQDHDFEVFIDPNGDNHDYYEFEINALGTGWDLLLPRPYKDGGRAVHDWEIAGLKSAVHLDGTLNDPADTDRGWTVELAFPWPALAELARRPAPPRDGDQWRVNFSRVEWSLRVAGAHYEKVPGTKENNWVWSPQGVVNMHRPETWGYVQFSTGRPGTASLQPDATLAARLWLHEVYYAQRAYREGHKRWAKTLDELGVAAPRDAALTRPALEVTTDLFQASADLRLPDGTTQRWNIRQDALVWPD
ncbi:MAG TPA: carbohydrate-binding family 9-like protein [Vicinamibacteria bacterium]|nr:carbohydrate-binding family 9-like protein [Vicinamibacteria bacterium]